VQREIGDLHPGHEWCWLGGLSLVYDAGKGMGTAIEKLSRPTINSSSWAGPGQRAGQAGWNILAPNSLPAVGSSVGGAFGTEFGSSVANKLKEPSK
jgi:hypothetical protein